MSTLSIWLPDDLKSFVDQQVNGRGYSSSSEYIRDLIRKDADRQHLRAALIEGAASPPALTADADYFRQLRDHIRSADRR